MDVTISTVSIAWNFFNSKEIYEHIETITSMLS